MDKKEKKKFDTFTEEEEKEIMKRLKRLGYM